MEKGQNVFIGGMDKDMSPAYQQANTYTDAWNVRLITDDGSSNGALINLKGSEERVALPDDSRTVINTPIGWGRIRDTLYLFTHTQFLAGGEEGRIYKVEFDDSNDTSTVTLLYSNASLNFSKSYLIGEAIGRYETESIQRLYWTDGLNPIRTINVALSTTDLATLSPADLNLTSAVNFNPLFLERIEQTGGSLQTGVYYYTYRLKGVDDQYTPYAPIIGPINIVEASDKGIDYQETEGNDTVTEPIPVSSKYTALSLTNDAPSSYNVIEVVSIYQNTKDGVLTINRFKEDRVSPGQINIFHFGDEVDTTPVTLSELTGTFASLSTGKTIAEKDNRLFIGNVKSFDREIREWESRVKRYKSTLESTYPMAGSDGTTDFTAQQFDYKYKSNGVTLGAEGDNISIEFKTTDITLEGTDTGNSIIPGAGLNKGNKNNEPTYQTRSLWEGTDALKTGQLANGLVSTYGNPVKASYLRGYQRGEVYRFGIIFYDLFGTPSSVKWIGDVKMPEIYDDFPLTTQDLDTNTSNPALNIARVTGHILYPEFTVDISSIEDKVSGFSIVRAERTENDRTVVGQGLLNPIQNESLSYADIIPFRTAFLSRSCLMNLSLYNSIRGVSIGSAYDPRKDLCTFDSPDTQIRDIEFQEGDYLRVVTMPVTNTYSGDLSNQSAQNRALGGRRFGKSNPAGINHPVASDYSPDGNPNKLNLKDAKQCLGDNGEVVIDSEKFVNGDGSTVAGGFGSKTLVCKLEGGSYNSTPDLRFSSLDKTQTLLANYIRPKNNQYGGRQVNSEGFIITPNNYLYTGQYQKADTSGTYIVDVFGGDIYLNWHGYLKARSFADSTAPSQPSFSTYFEYFAVESIINLELREGPKLSGIYTVGGADNTYNEDIQRFGDNWSYNSVFSSDNAITIFKPNVFDEQISEVFDTRMYYTDEKINGNSRDDWSIIRFDDYHEVESKYGPLNSLIVLNDRMYAFQDRGISIIVVNPRALLSSDETDLVLGSGNVIDDISYIATNSGTKHKFGAVASDNYIYYVDTIQKRIKRIGSEGIQELRGLDGYLRTFLKGPIQTTDDLYAKQGIVVAYDSVHQEVIFGLNNFGATSTIPSTPTVPTTIINSKTNNDSQKTLVFSEKAESFQSFISPTPYMYVNMGNRVMYPLIGISSSSINLFELNAGEYNKFGKNYYDTRLEFISNDNPGYTKVFDNLVFFTEVEKGGKTYNEVTFTKLKCTTGYQNTDYVNLLYKTNIVRKDRGFATPVPRNIISKDYSDTVDITKSNNFNSSRAFKERLRDKYMKTELVFDNAHNYKLKLHYIQTLYRVNHR